MEAKEAADLVSCSTNARTWKKVNTPETDPQGTQNKAWAQTLGVRGGGVGVGAVVGGADDGGGWDDGGGGVGGSGGVRGGGGGGGGVGVGAVDVGAVVGGADDGGGWDDGGGGVGGSGGVRGGGGGGGGVGVGAVGVVAVVGGADDGGGWDGGGGVGGVGGVRGGGGGGDGGVGVGAVVGGTDDGGGWNDGGGGVGVGGAGGVRGGGGGGDGVVVVVAVVVEMKLVQDEPEPAPTAAGHSPKAKAQPSQPSSADSEFLMPSSKDISEQVEHSIQDKSFARIMEVVRGSEYYNKDLNEHDILELIPRGLAISPHNPDYLCCVYCRSKNQIGPYTIFPSGNGTKNHFKRARHDVREPQVPEPSQPPPPDPAARSHPALAVSPPPSPPIPPPPPRLPVFLRLRRLRHPNLLSPSLLRHFLPLQHPRLLHQTDQTLPIPSQSPIVRQLPLQVLFVTPGPSPKKAKPASAKAFVAGPVSPPLQPTAPPQYEPPKYHAPQMSYLPQLTDYEEIPLTKEGIQHELQSAETQDWVRALANFQVLGSSVVLGGLDIQEQRPIWAKRVRDLSMVPALFRAITKVTTEKGLTCKKILTVRQVLTKEGKITVATGHEETYVELASPTKIHGLVGALFRKMWSHEEFAKFFKLRELSMT